jgi:hypothetical protein
MEGWGFWSRNAGVFFAVGDKLVSANCGSLHQPKTVLWMLEITMERYMLIYLGYESPKPTFAECGRGISNRNPK